MASDVHDFLHYLGGHPEVREKLYHAVEEDIIEAAKQAGFQLSATDLDDLMEHSREHRAMTAWSR